MYRWGKTHPICKEVILCFVILKGKDVRNVKMYIGLVVYFAVKDTVENGK